MNAIAAAEERSITMRIGKTIGIVTLCRWHPLLVGGSYRLAVPLSLANLVGESDTFAEEIVVYDEFGAADDTIIAITEGPEAAQPFFPAPKPIDAYNAAILDHLDIDR
jgi:ethanolamine utilization protein EutN